MRNDIQIATFFEQEDIILPVANLIKSGFEGKFTRRMFSEKDIDQITVALSTLICTQQPENLLIARKENNICGCLYFININNTNFSINRTLKQFLTLTKRVKLILLLDFLSHKPKQNETHIDFLSVSPKFSGLGIATNLINYCKDINTPDELTLHVAKENTAALNLYQKKHFTINKTISSYFSYWLTGTNTWYFMNWS